MKSIYKLLILVLVLALISSSMVMAKKARKLPVGSYITSAKIEILSQDRERLFTAIAMLDSLYMHYGPHAEAIYWMAKIKGDLLEQESVMDNKLPLVEEIVKLRDSLKWCCDNNDIKKKYRKNCDELAEEMDSVLVYLWRSFYNDGIDQKDRISEINESIEMETDSISLEMYNDERKLLTDSCYNNMNLAILVDDSDDRTYLTLATVFEWSHEYEKAGNWLKKAYESDTTNIQLLPQIAYDYIQLDQYCEAIPWFRTYVDKASADAEIMADPQKVNSVASTMFNLSVCYNNCKHYDSAYAVYQSILTLQPENTDVMTSAGRYQNEMARQCSDSANYYKKQDDQATSDKWNELKELRFDSARVFFKQVFDLKPDDALAAEEYGIIAALLKKLDEAALAFGRATELDPSNVDNWTSLGDMNLGLKDFEKAARAYEKVVELTPDDKNIWEYLRDLYHELGEKKNEANAVEKLKSL